LDLEYFHEAQFRVTDWLLGCDDRCDRGLPVPSNYSVSRAENQSNCSWETILWKSGLLEGRKAEHWSKNDLQHGLSQIVNWLYWQPTIFTKQSVGVGARIRGDFFPDCQRLKTSNMRLLESSGSKSYRVD
jgi:hypothetical protein